MAVKKTRIHTDQTLRVEDKIHISFADIGPRTSDDVVLLLHGLFSSADNTFGSATGFADAIIDEDFRCILMDFRGHGGSSKPYDSGKYGLQMIEDINKLLNHLKLEKVHIVGYSMGAECAIYYSIHNGERVKSLAIAGSGWSDEHQAKLYQSFGQCCASIPGSPCGINCACWARFCWYPCCCPLLCYSCAGCVPDLKAGIKCAEAMGREIVDLPEEKVQKLEGIPVLAIGGGKDPEVKCQQRLEGVLSSANFEFKQFDKYDHDGIAGSKEWREEAVKFLARVRGNRGSAPQQEQM
eukprot:TRINITY_DN24373_c0_g1_i1.p1 TRINITY_DN24373_c0_g1~~TRINITY_DN24373_c0_g1_i1.p1  ORF type:complete len:295 (-),score=26.13 TRINITY_DN24373_c0_g1_i1:88-972(-)